MVSAHNLKVGCDLPVDNISAEKIMGKMHAVNQ